MKKRSSSWTTGKWESLCRSLRPLRRPGRDPCGGKWVNVNKGDEVEPVIRSRYGACEVNTHKDESLFASTPPLEALRLLLSWTASGPRTGGHKRKILKIDVRKAHLHALAVREVYVQPPPEVRARNPGKCWKLKRCLYGTRDAPARWEALYIEQLGKLGSRLG